MDDYLSKLTLDLTKNISSFMTSEDEKILFALTVPGGEQTYYDLRKDVEYWLEKLGKYSQLVPAKYLNDVISLERFYNIFMLMEEKDITKSAFRICSSMIPELYNLIQFLLGKGDLPLNEENIDDTSTNTLKDAFQLYLQNVVHMPMVLVETLFQLVGSEMFNFYVSEYELYYSLGYSSVEAILKQKGRIGDILRIVDFLGKYFSEEIKKQFIEEYLHEFDYTDYESAREIKDVIDTLAKQGYTNSLYEQNRSVKFRFNKDDSVRRIDFGNKNDSFYFPELFKFLIDIEFKTTNTSYASEPNTYSDNKIEKLTKEPITLKFLLYLIFTTEKSCLEKIFDKAVLEENTLSDFGKIVCISNTKFVERLKKIESSLAIKLLSILLEALLSNIKS